MFEKRHVLVVLSMGMVMQMLLCRMVMPMVLVDISASENWDVKEQVEKLKL